MPPHPPYSSGVRALISSMLQEKAAARPNIYQVHEQVCRLRGTQVSIPNVSPQTPESLLICLGRSV